MTFFCFQKTIVKLPQVVVVCALHLSLEKEDRRQLPLLLFFLSFQCFANRKFCFSQFSHCNNYNISNLCSCGTCGYELNLSSSNRNISSIGSKYGKSIKRGIISFLNVDDSRFTRADEIEFAPYFSKHKWGLFRRKTKLLCRKCCNHIGYAYNDRTSSFFPFVSNRTEPSPPTEASNSSPMKYDIRIRALQPSSSQEHGITVLA